MLTCQRSYGPAVQENRSGDRCLGPILVLAADQCFGNTDDFILQIHLQPLQAEDVRGLPHWLRLRLLMRQLDCIAAVHDAHEFDRHAVSHAFKRAGPSPEKRRRTVQAEIASAAGTKTCIRGERGKSPTPSGIPLHRGRLSRQRRGISRSMGRCRVLTMELVNCITF